MLLSSVYVMKFEVCLRSDFVIVPCLCNEV